MEIIKRRLIKNLVYNRKTTNKATPLEVLGLGKIPTEELITKILAEIDFNNLSRVCRIINKSSKRLTLSVSQLKEQLHKILTDMLNRFEIGTDYAVYTAQDISVMLSLNKKDYHIITIMPNLDVI